MIEIENEEIVGWEAAIRGMRNPMNSWGEDWGLNGKFILPYTMSFTEARGIEDYDNRLDEEDDPIKEPSFAATLKIVYMIINKILNFFKGRGQTK